MEAEVCSSTSQPERAKLALSSSPPPNCAICLSDCDNKSFTDRCMHQFCFACLLRWSKVKAECPLCKQPFKSIIHNVRSNSDYEELMVMNNHLQGPAVEEYNHEDISVEFEPHYYLPTVPPPARRRFQYRTTLYLDPHEDIAIQQMLMTHPMTNTVYMPRRSSNYRIARLLGTSHPTNSLDFRNAIYQHNWWVNPSPTDVTGRYRDCSPQFFRENPAQRNRIVPWLLRELNALLNENGPHSHYVMSLIVGILTEHHINSPEFRSRVCVYFADKADHFIHEFYNFLRSPYDMVGYDRNCQYTQRIQNIELSSTSSSSESDSDVEVISTQEPSIIISESPSPPAEIIVLSDTDTNNSDVIYREPTPPPIVTITDSDEPAALNPPPNPAPLMDCKAEDVSDPERRASELKEGTASFVAANNDHKPNIRETAVYNWDSSESTKRNSCQPKREVKNERERRPRKPIKYEFSSSTSSSTSSSESSSDSSYRRIPKRKRVFKEETKSSDRQPKRLKRRVLRKRRRVPVRAETDFSSDSSDLPLAVHRDRPSTSYTPPQSKGRPFEFPTRKSPNGRPWFDRPEHSSSCSDD